MIRKLSRKNYKLLTHHSKSDENIDENNNDKINKPKVLITTTSNAKLNDSNLLSSLSQSSLNFFATFQVEYFARVNFMAIESQMC